MENLNQLTNVYWKQQWHYLNKGRKIYNMNI